MKHKEVVIDLDRALKVIPLVKDRVVFVSELWDQCWFFFTRPTSYDEGVVKKRWKADTGALILDLAERLIALPEFTQVLLEAEIKQFLEERGVGMGVVMNALRLAMFGSMTTRERLRNRLSRFGVLRARRGLWSLKITLQGFLREFRWNLSAPPISGVSPGSVMKKCWKKVPVFESFYGNIYLK
jgi:hypothetical protein